MKVFFVVDSKIMKDISDAIIAAVVNGTCSTEKEAEEIAVSLCDNVRWVHFFGPRDDHIFGIGYSGV